MLLQTSPAFLTWTLVPCHMYVSFRNKCYLYKHYFKVLCYQHHHERHISRKRSAAKHISPPKDMDDKVKIINLNYDVHFCTKYKL